MTEEKEKKQKTAVRKRDGIVNRSAHSKTKDNTPEQAENRATIHLMVDGSKPVFPGLMFPLPFASGLQADTLRDANATDHILGFVYTLRELEADPKAEQSNDDGKEHEAKRIKRKELAPVGTTARIMRFEELPDGNAHGLFQGLKRFKLLAVRVENGKLMGDIEYLEEEPIPEEKQKPLFLAMQASMRTILKLNPTYSEELQSLVERADQKELAKLADFTVVLTSATAIELQLVLEELDVRERVKDVLAILKKEIIALKAKEDISREVDGRLSKQQHEFVLREQMRYIKEQLGIGHNNKSDEDYYQTRLEEIREFIPDEVADKVQDEIDKLNLLTPQSPEYTVSRNYLDWLTGLPWTSRSRAASSTATTTASKMSKSAFWSSSASPSSKAKSTAPSSASSARPESERPLLDTASRRRSDGNSSASPSAACGTRRRSKAIAAPTLERCPEKSSKP